MFLKSLTFGKYRSKFTGDTILPCPDSKGKEIEVCLNERHPISFHKKKNIMEKKTNVGENEKKLICLNTIDRHEKGHGLGIPKPK